MTREELIEYIKTADGAGSALPYEDLSLESLHWLKQKIEKRKRKQENPQLLAKIIRSIIQKVKLIKIKK